MPEFKAPDGGPVKQLIVSFASMQDYYDFQNVIGQKLTDKTRSIYFPEGEKLGFTDQGYVATK